MHTKFGDSRFSRCGDMIAGIEIENGSCAPDHTPFRGGLVCHPIARKVQNLIIPCFSRSGDVIGAHENLNGSRDLTTPLSGMICYAYQI